MNKRTKLVIGLLGLLLMVTPCVASGVIYSDSATYAYVVRGADTLLLDFYTPISKRQDAATVVYLYGGAFINGQRGDKQTRLDVAALLDRGFQVAAIDYRKYLSQVQLDTVSHRRVFDHLDSAIFYGASDCAAAVAFLCAHANDLGIDTSKIVLAGSSAGAISVLQLDYCRSNQLPVASLLPMGWKPAAVVSMSGAVFAHHS
ncbi:MAG: alpha/beta hydrolase, partial [Bacteroidales bacterium]|nr:alpha/beta hydrolase [Candidatus Colimorpha onthohippi]